MAKAFRTHSQAAATLIAVVKTIQKPPHKQPVCGELLIFDTNQQFATHTPQGHLSRHLLRTVRHRAIGFGGAWQGRSHHDDDQGYRSCSGSRGVAAVVLAIVLYLREPLHLLVTRAAESLKVKALRFKLFGLESELTVEEAKGTLDEMLQEIFEATNELSPGEVALFQAINRAEGRLSVVELVPGLKGFRRGDEAHTQLRRLRDRKLIRPFEGGNWQSEKHPIVTRFGKLVQSLRPQIGVEAAEPRVSPG